MPTHETPQETLEEILAQVEDLTLPSRHIALQEAQAMLPKVHTAAELMSIIRGELDSDVVVRWVNTGGGCMVIEARLKDARDDVYLYITPSTDTFGRDDFGLPVDTQGEGYLICSYIGEECEPFGWTDRLDADHLHDVVRRMSLAAEIEAGNREAEEAMRPAAYDPSDPIDGVDEDRLFNMDHGILTVGRLREILAEIPAETQICIDDEAHAWWLNIDSVRLPIDGETVTVDLHIGTSFDTRQI